MKFSAFFPPEPNPKRMKPNPSEKNVSTSWTQEPRSVTDLVEARQSPIPEHRHHRYQIRTRSRRQNPVLDWYNFRLFSLQPQELVNRLEDSFTDQSIVFKLNVSFGFIRNNETGTLQYYYVSRNNEQVGFEKPFQIATAAGIQQVRQGLENLHVLEWVRQRRPNSKWVIALLMFVRKVYNTVAEKVCVA